jgi:class 3 adenylate cyclase/tetratricopeptide (TPR) repeat protein
MAACPSCGEENPERSKFCSECGASLLSVVAAPETEERKVVTVLFCDLVGFTARSDTADPEDVRATIRPFHALLRTEIERHGGTVEKFIGDAVMAVFGAPTAHEDDAERAVRSGIRILEAIGELNEDRPGLELAVRIGINSGEAVVALSARPELGEGIVTGDVVNTASRLQGAAPVGAVVVGEATYQATKDVIDYEALDPVELKGKAEPVPLWRVISARARFGSDLMRRHTVPLVGREVERGILQGLFERAARGNAVQLATLVGEPGVGKSRMVFELESFIEERPELVLWRQGRCLPYGEGITFWALGEIVKHEAGILESDTPEQAAAKLDRVMRVPDEEREWFRARLAPLVGAEGGAAADREESFTAWRRFLESLVVSGPGVFVFEDLHWADPALLEFLEHLVDWSEGVPMLIVCTARPEIYEKHPTWAGGKRNATTISLDPLTEEETARLVSELLDQTVLPADVQTTILERAGGNALYAEEFVRMLKDRGALVRRGRTWELVGDGDIAAPEGVHALIAARLDTLAPERKALLRDAAVLGKVFWGGAVAAMGSREEREVRDALHELTRKELVRPLRETSMAGETEYTFWHMLVRDVAYQQIPRAERAIKHRAAADWIEAQAGERVEDLAEVLAHHLGEAMSLTEAVSGDAADLRERTLGYLTLAADRAGNLDVARSEVLWSKALDLTPPDHPERPRVLEHLGGALRQLDRLEQAAAVLQEGADLFREVGRLEDCGRVLVALAGAQRTAGVAQERTIHEAIQLLERLPPGEAYADALAEKAAIEYTQGDDNEAVRWAVRALELVREVGLPENVTALGVLGGARATLGDERGLEDMRRALSIGLARGEGRRTAVVYNNLGIELWISAGPTAADPILREGIAFAQARGILDAEAYTRGTLLSIGVDAGAWDDVVEEIRALRSLPAWTEDVALRTTLAAAEVRVASARGHHRQAVDVSADIEELAGTVGEPQLTIEAYASAATARERAGDRDGALALLGEIAGDRTYRRVWNYAKCLPDLTRTALRLDLSVARALNTDVHEATAGQRRWIGIAGAVLAEGEGRHELAAVRYLEVVDLLASEGWTFEEALSRLGAGRCLFELSDPRAADELRRARMFFAGVGAVPLLAETDALLERALSA